MILQLILQALAGLSADDSGSTDSENVCGGSPLTTAASVLADMGKLDSTVILGRFEPDHGL